MSTEKPTKMHPSQKQWRRALAKYEKPAISRSVWQIVNTVVPYIVMWGLMIWSLDISLWLTLALSIPAAGFMVRTFIISHDCGHGSFFKSHRANDIVGFITGVVAFTPFHDWRRDHAIHHATSGDLDRRSIGDVWTLTVQEYLDGSRWLRFRYKVFRNPLIMFLIGPLVLFVIWHRVPGRSSPPRERRSVMWTNLALLGIAVALSLTIGWKSYLIIQGLIMLFAGPAGVWLFYVQHQFEEAYWERHDEWRYIPACLQGSSYYKLPNVLQWFTGNIGFHHIHHLSPRVPNYYLQRCHEENAYLMIGEPLTLLSSLRSLRFRLWDEERGKMISFGQLKKQRAA